MKDERNKDVELILLYKQPITGKQWGLSTGNVIKNIYLNLKQVMN